MSRHHPDPAPTQNPNQCSSRQKNQPALRKFLSLAPPRQKHHLPLKLIAIAMALQIAPHALLQQGRVNVPPTQKKRLEIDF
jgi:hypothetical protein